MEKPEEVEEKLVDNKFENIESKSNIIDEEESIEVQLSMCEYISQLVRCKNFNTEFENN